MARSAALPLYAAPRRVLKTALGKSGVLTRAVGVTDAHTPLIHVFGGRRRTHFLEVDVLVLGHNTLLGAILVGRAIRYGLRPLYVGTPGLDGFPEGLFEHEGFRDAIGARLGVKPCTGRSVDWDLGLASALVDDIPLDHVVRLDHGLGLSLAGQAEGYFVFDLVDALPTADSPQLFPKVFHAKLAQRSRCLRQSAHPLRSTVVLARRVVLTSPPSGVMPVRLLEDEKGTALDWGDITAFGTARRVDRSVTDAVTAMIEDIESCQHWR